MREYLIDPINGQNRKFVFNGMLDIAQVTRVVEPTEEELINYAAMAIVGVPLYAQNTVGLFEFAFADGSMFGGQRLLSEVFPQIPAIRARSMEVAHV